MKKTTITTALALAASTMAPAIMAPAQAQDAAAQEAQDERPYSVETTLVGTLLDDPEAAAILQRLIPTIYANEMFQNMGRPQPLRAIQQYEGAVLNDEMLARIQAELDALPPRD